MSSIPVDFRTPLTAANGSDSEGIWALKCREEISRPVATVAMKCCRMAMKLKASLWSGSVWDDVFAEGTGARLLLQAPAI